MPDTLVLSFVVVVIYYLEDAIFLKLTELVLRWASFCLDNKLPK